MSLGFSRGRNTYFRRTCEEDRGKGEEEHEKELTPYFQEYWERLEKRWADPEVLVHAGVNGTSVPPNGGGYTTYLRCFHLRPDLMKHYLG